jgi:hypothetical protein
MLGVIGPAFVGRSAVLAWVRAAWTRATHGNGGVVFVVGGPGMGKTGLAAELAREVHGAGGWVLYGRCAATADDPLQPFTQALAASSPGRDVPSVQRSPAAFGESLAGLAGRADAGVLLVLMTCT